MNIHNPLMIIDDSEQNQLREKFNPDGSLLRQHQLRMLEMLQYIDDLCKSNNINYWLSSGTLLGAVRHGGFIPWDDDLDVEMLRPDYDRLIEILKKQKSSKYIIQTYDTDTKYVIPFAKLRDLHSSVVEENSPEYRYNGCWVDIFPLEKNTMPCLKFTVYIYYFFLAPYGIIKNRPMVLSKVYKFIIYKLFFKLIYRINKILPLKKYYHTCGVEFYKSRNLKEIFPLQKIKFEGQLFPAPQKCDSYLSNIYGDYSKIPSINKIETHNLKIVFSNSI